MSAPVSRVDETALPSDPARSTEIDSVPRGVLLRATIWGLFGLIYAPLFLGLVALLKGLGAGTWSYVGAATIAGCVTAVLYGARSVGLAGAGVGLVVGGLLQFSGVVQVSLLTGVVVAVGTAFFIGLAPGFPGRCASHVPAKAVGGALGGVVGGLVVAIAEPLHPHAFTPFVVLAFLVSVNGVLYVSSVPRLARLAGALRWRSRHCNLVELGVIVIMAGFTAGSMWVVSATMLGGTTDLVRDAAEAILRQAPAAIPGAIYGGALAGALLELFRFRWVHDV